MIQRLVEAILRPVLDLAATLMANLFLAPFKALFGPRGEDREEREPELDGDQPAQLEDRGEE